MSSPTSPFFERKGNRSQGGSKNPDSVHHRGNDVRVALDVWARALSPRSHAQTIPFGAVSPLEGIGIKCSTSLPPTASRILFTQDLSEEDQR